MLGGDGGFATARWRAPASSDRPPSHRSESPTGYSSAGCSPAEPASASPVTDNSSSILIQRGNQIRCSTFTAAMQFKPRSSCSPPTGGVISTLRAECHFYLAPTQVDGTRCSDIRDPLLKRGLEIEHTIVGIHRILEQSREGLFLFV